MILGILKFVLICIEVVLLFNLLILVHELGHFLAARWRGLVVEKFAIWFGKPIWKRTIGGVEYRLGSIPAGGFVAIPQLAPMEALEGATENARASLPPVKPLDKIIVAAAGPLFSFALALAMACVVWAVGKPEGEFDSTRVGYLREGGPAAQAGFHIGDEILEVDGHPVKRFFTGTDSIKWRVIRSEGETISFTVRRDGQVVHLATGWTKPETSSWRRPALREVGIGPLRPPGVGFVVAGSPAASAGLQAGDLVTAVNGQPIFDLGELGDHVNQSHGKPLLLTIDRRGALLQTEMSIPAAADVSRPVNLGVEWGRVRFVHPSPWSQVSDAATSIFRMMGALFSAKSDVKAAHFSGPVGIMRLYYQVFETDYGWRLALSLSVLINVNLALLNMLPFPVLDGGHITLALIETVRRKPVNVRLLEVLQTACAVLLIGFMLYVTFFDVGDIVSQKDPSKSEEPAGASPSPAATP